MRRIAVAREGAPTPGIDHQRLLGYAHHQGRSRGWRYVVSCPAIPGCHSQGETLEEARENIKDAISGCIEVLNERVTQRPGERLTDVAL